MTLIGVAKVLLIAVAFGLSLWLGDRLGKRLHRWLRRREGRDFVNLTAERRATFSENSQKSPTDIGETARPGAKVALLSLHKRNGSPNGGSRQGVRGSE